MVDPSPNSPLLIRLNTHPYELPRSYPKKLKLREARDSSARVREPSAPLMQVAAREMARPRHLNPIKMFNHVPTPVSIPSVDSWLAGGAR